MKLKRIQIVTNARNKRLIQLDKQMPMGVVDFCAERAIEVFSRQLVKRVLSDKPLCIRRPLDMIAMCVHAGRIASTVGYDNDRKFHTASQVRNIFHAICDTEPVADHFGEIQGQYINRYTSLFMHFYGKDLERLGVVDDR